MRLVLSVLTATAALSGCGAADEPRGQRAPEAGTRPASPEADDSTSDDQGFSFVLFGHEGASRPPSQLYSAFRRPATFADRRALEQADESAAWALGVAASGRAERELGEALLERGRLLVRDAGLRGGDLLAFPTTTGAVCYAIVPHGGGGCGKPSEHGVEVSGEMSGRRGALYGLVPDGVTHVYLIAAHGRIEAHVGENAFSVRAEREAVESVRAVVLRRADGSTSTIELPGYDDRTMDE